MKWNYRRCEVERSTICPTGVAYRPVVRVRIAGLLSSAYLRALVDTGADHTLLPLSVAEVIGAELYLDQEDAAVGFSGHEISVTPGRVELELRGGGESYRWSAVIGFARFEAAEDECSILGHLGCLEYFHAGFDGVTHVVELTPRCDLPQAI